MDSTLHARMAALGLDNHIHIETGEMWAEYGLIAAGLHTEPRPLVPCAYSQRNEIWGDVPLGRSGKTIRSHGCTMTAVTMLMTMINPELTPGSVGKWLNDNGGYTSEGNLWWAKPAEMIDGFGFINRTEWIRIGCDMDMVRAALEHNPQLIQVDFHPGSVLDQHWVLALDFTADGKDLHIIDPWTGQHGLLLGMYGEALWDLARAIYAMAEYRLT